MEAKGLFVRPVYSTLCRLFLFTLTFTLVYIQWCSYLDDTYKTILEMYRAETFQPP